MAAHPAALDRLLGPHLTLDEWRDLPEDVPDELVDGRIVEEELPAPLHEVIVTWLARILRNWAGDAIVLGSETRFALSASHGRKPLSLREFVGRHACRNTEDHLIPRHAWSKATQLA